MECALRRRATLWKNCSRGGALSGVKKCLPSKQEQQERQGKNPVFEDLPSEPQPLAIAGEHPGEHRHGERGYERKPDDPQKD